MDFLRRLLRARATASHFLLRLGWVILPPAVPQATVKAGSPAAFPRLAREKDSRRVVAAVSFAARSSPAPARFAFVLFALCRCPIGFATVDPVIAAADLFSLAGSDLAAAAAAVGSVVAAGLSVAVDSVATVFAAADSGFVVAADLACSVVGSVCSFAAATGKGRVVVAIFCSLTPRSSF